MSLEPSYAPEVMTQLEKIEHDTTRERLWEAICDAIDLICDYPESGQARRQAWRRRAGGPVWQVALRNTGEDEDWVVLWFRNHDEAKIVYIGPAI